eukprot:COSAG02_NODE_51104_length_316_cov_0.778802_1_plen_38_part_10
MTAQISSTPTKRRDARINKAAMVGQLDHLHACTLAALH